MDTLFSDKPETYRALINRSLLLYKRSLWNSLVLGLLCACSFYLIILLPIFFGEMMRFSLFEFRGQIFRILGNFLALFFFIMLSWHCYCTMRNRNEPLLEDFKKGMNKIISVLITAMIANGILYLVNLGLFIFLLTADYYLVLWHHTSWPDLSLIYATLLFVGGVFLLIYMSTLFSFIVPLIAIENKNIFIALKQSIVYTWNHWWRAFSVQMTPWFYYFIMLVILNKIFYYFFIQVFLIYLPWWSLTLRFILLALFIPWIASVQLVQLKDFELRKK